MKNQLTLIVYILMVYAASAQSTISGTVTDKSNEPISGANVYLEGTYDGSSTDENGQFSFETEETGTQTLVVSMLTYETHYEMGDIKYLNNITIKLTEAINSLTGVTLTAGTFEAGDNSKVSVLKPLDIVTTAGAAGDFVAALQTLPGTSSVNEDGRLFVRGGQAGETQIFVDGLRVFQPFNASANNIPTRGRFSPFLFKGITFSTGGYSAEYGQALSSILLLNTTDVPEQEKTDISVMSVGGGLSHTKIWGNTSLSVNTQYINLEPYEALIPSDQGVSWNDPYESLAGEAVFRIKSDKSIFKLYTGYNNATLDINQEDINFETPIRFNLQNNNLYLNSSYKHFFDNNWTIFSGASISNDVNKIGVIANEIDAQETAGHLKIKANKGFSNRFSLNLGAEVFRTQYDETFTTQDNFTFNSDYDDTLLAGFAEADIFFSNDLALKLGSRLEYSALLNEVTISPRLSLAYKTSDASQFSLAYGDFYQNPLTEVLKFDQTLGLEKTSHYILNYQYF